MAFNSLARRGQVTYQLPLSPLSCGVAYVVVMIGSQFIGGLMHNRTDSFEVGVVVLLPLLAVVLTCFYGYVWLLSPTLTLSKSCITLKSRISSARVMTLSQVATVTLMECGVLSESTLITFLGLDERPLGSFECYSRSAHFEPFLATLRASLPETVNFVACSRKSGRAVPEYVLAAPSQRSALADIACLQIGVVVPTSTYQVVPEWAPISETASPATKWIGPGLATLLLVPVLGTLLCEPLGPREIGFGILDLALVSGYLVAALLQVRREYSSRNAAAASIGRRLSLTGMSCEVDDGVQTTPIDSIAAYFTLQTRNQLWNPTRASKVTVWAAGQRLEFDSRFLVLEMPTSPSLPPATSGVK